MTGLGSAQWPRAGRDGYEGSMQVTTDDLVLVEAQPRRKTRASRQRGTTRASRAERAFGAHTPTAHRCHPRPRWL